MEENKSNTRKPGKRVLIAMSVIVTVLLAGLVVLLVLLPGIIREQNETRTINQLGSVADQVLELRANNLSWDEAIEIAANETSPRVPEVFRVTNDGEQVPREQELTYQVIEDETAAALAIRGEDNLVCVSVLTEQDASVQGFSSTCRLSSDSDPITPVRAINGELEGFTPIITD